MSVDLYLVEGFGIDLDDLHWKDMKELTDYFRNEVLPTGQITFSKGVEFSDETAETIIQNFIEQTIEDELIENLQYVCVNDNHYIFAPTIFPTQTDVEESKIWTRKELGHKIHQMLKNFIHNTEDEVAERLGHVFDWETC